MREEDYYPVYMLAIVDKVVCVKKSETILLLCTTSCPNIRVLAPPSKLSSCLLGQITESALSKQTPHLSNQYAQPSITL